MSLPSTGCQRSTLICFEELYDCGGYESLDAKIGSALMKELRGYLLNEVSAVRDKMTAEKKTAAPRVQTSPVIATQAKVNCTDRAFGPFTV